MSKEIAGGIIIDDDIDAAYSKAGASGMTFQRLSGAAQGVQGLAQMASAYSGYAQNSISADFLRLQAEQVGIQAEQRANMLREQLFANISNAMAGYAAAGAVLCMLLNLRIRKQVK